MGRMGRSFGGRVALGLACCVVGVGGLARGDVITNIPEVTLDGYQLVYTLPIPDSATYNTNPVPYSADYRYKITGPYSRVAYYLELQQGANPLQYVYVSMDTLTGDTSRIGVPTSYTSSAPLQRIVNNMNVVSNVPGIVTGAGIATGNVEFWNSNYTAANGLPIPGASGSAYDFGDTVSAGNYGSMQIHNYGAGQTLFAMNRWGGTGGITDLGIGNRPATVDTDWTFAQNANTYTVKNLQVLVKPSASFAPSYLSDVPESSDYQIVYSLPIPQNNCRFNTTGAPYDYANPGGIVKPYDRVAYYLELQPTVGTRQWAWVSMDTFTRNPYQLGVPTTVSGGGAYYFDNVVKNMTVASNVPGVVTGTGIATGNLEFWPSNYSQNSGGRVPGENTGRFDFGDGGYSTGAGHGSMQIHNYGAGQTIIGFSDWGGNNPGSNVELGIGNRPTGEPDWTFSDSAGNYTVRNLYVLVHYAPVPTGNTAPGGFEPLGTPLNGALYWLRADQGVTASGGAVSAWNDQSGNARDFTQATAVKQPQLVPGVLNGLPVVRFDGDLTGNSGGVAPNADEVILSASTTPRTVFLVNTLAAGNVGLAGIWGQNDADSGIRRASNTTWQNPGNSNDWTNPAGSAMYVNGQAFAGNATANEGVPHILSATRGTATAWAATSLGDYFRSGSVTPRPYKGDIAEVIAFDRVLNLAERQIVENALSAKYAIPLIAGDVYAGDIPGRDYDFDVFGVGRVNATNYVIQAGAAGLGVEADFGTLGDNEWLLGGHKTPVNADLDGRWARVWYLDVTGSFDAKLIFDASDAGIETPPTIASLLYSATDAPFSFTELGVTPSFEGDRIVFSVPSNLLVSGFFTLGTVPEPATCLLLAGGLLALARRRRKA
ncbi:MAG TPA: PEP-CTERM sorting domain-containing protein [Planctomycetota bacterium]|nr:PEP-CTERM sorting domain-containing protein [Planctomycetota bacterium]HRR81153.1 PEP-CTERM sorting domain-containing protein [Planctomycetota bacterium]HRT94088.1 PEP-CTERM sorting domain-containing protein [Planctomycetota bacterium]